MTLTEILKRLEDKIDRVLKIELALAREMIIMSDQINAALAKLAADFDAETNAVAAKLDALAAALASAASPVDPAVMAQLQAVSDRLKALGADPAAPIPAAPEAPVAGV